MMLAYKFNDRFGSEKFQLDSNGPTVNSVSGAKVKVRHNNNSRGGEWFPIGL